MPESAPPSSEWYADGLRFECTQCGNCCTGPPGAVWFTDDEAEKMAGWHKLGVQAFLKKYARRLDNRWSLKEHKTEHGYDCIFLDRTTIPGKAVCSMYGARPTQCRTWPFWPENLESPDAWEYARRATPCPGMESGKVIPIDRIRIQRDQTE